jgi:colanic acid/amylovoran biosynthesis glycosyltransferase
LEHGSIRTVGNDSKLAVLFTTFPKTSESFLQREVDAMIAGGLEPALFSLWGGGGEFRGRRIGTFNKWRLVPLLLLIIPWNFLRRPRIIRDLFAGVFSRLAPSWINFWENMLGAGFAGVAYCSEFRESRPAEIHAPWGGAPATAAWLLWRIHGVPYSVGVHAYDLYEHGGDWWLLEKVAHARFVRTSTEMAREELIRRGAPAEKIHCIRRGMAEFPALKPLRASRSPLRIACVARLVEKKGLRWQMKMYAALKEAGVAFEARIAGDGPLRAEIEAAARANGVEDRVVVLGEIPHEMVWTLLGWADVLIHTGVVSASGDRDGLPNVIPEAMSAGTLVVSSPVAATTEAVHDGETGLIAPVGDTAAWVQALQRLAADDALAEKLRAGARRWVEENYDARKNVARLIALCRAEMS